MAADRRAHGALSAVAAVLATFALACGIGAAPPTPTPLPLPSSTPTVSPTPTLGNRMGSRAIPLCTRALDAPPPGSAGTVQGPALYYIAVTTLGGPTSRTTPSDFSGGGFPSELNAVTSATNEADIKSLVCVRSVETMAGTYTGTGIRAVRRDWVMRVVRWPDGTVVAGRVIEGVEPPSQIQRREGDRDDEVGRAPLDAANAWLKTVYR